MSDSLSKNQFYRDGYALVKDVLPVSIITDLQLELDEFAKIGKNPYVYESSVVQSVVFGEKIKSLASTILGDRYFYLPDYSFNAIDFWASFGWHKDSVDRYDPDGTDWETSWYPIIRFGIYLGDYSASSGSLGIQIGSNSGPTYANSGVNVKTRPGDVVIWPLTTTHTANSPSFSVRPNTALTPPLNLKIARALTNKLGNLANAKRLGIQESLQNRQVLFFTLGKPGPYLARYISYLLHRDYFRDFIQSDPFKGDVHSATDEYQNVNWLRLKGLLDKVDMRLVSHDFDQVRAQASSLVLYDELLTLFEQQA